MKITRYCSITDNAVYLNGKAVLNRKEGVLSLPDFLNNIYESQKVLYPKYFKMDDLSKLCFLTSEVLLKDSDARAIYRPNQIGVIISNSSSSISTDLAYFETIRDKDNFFPSPALFTYTLPNIMIAEICIRNNFRGENAFVVSDGCEFRFVSEYIRALFLTKSINACLFGWCDYYSAEARVALKAHQKQNICTLMMIEEDSAGTGTLDFDDNSLAHLLNIARQCDSNCI